MPMPPQDETDLPLPIALAAIGMPIASFRTLEGRGQISDAFFGSVKRGRGRMLSRRGTLALALYRTMTSKKLEIEELPPEACIRWADLWLRTRSTGKPVRELIVRYYGRSSDPDFMMSLLPNDDVLEEPPTPGALITIRFDLDAIFSRAEQGFNPRPSTTKVYGDV
jgi:hypothetical protein